MNISASIGLFTVNFNQKQHWGGGRLHEVLGQIRILVSIAADSSNGYNWENGLAIFSPCFSFNPLCMMAQRSSQFGAIRPPTAE